MSIDRPVRVFTEIKSSQKSFPKSAENIKYLPIGVGLEIQDNKYAASTKTMNISADDRQIIVTGVGELDLPPDRFSVTIRCKASKDDLQDAKNSVKKRVDYILQTLKNNSLKDEDIAVYQHTNHSDSKVNIECEVEAHFTDLTKCQSISNLLAEKLGPAVNVSMPRCYHAKGSLDKLRKQVGMLAIHNARQKAKEMAKVVHLSVGPALKVEEIETIESQGVEEKNDEDFELNPSIQQRVTDATISITNKINVNFVLKASHTKKNHKA